MLDHRSVFDVIDIKDAIGRHEVDQMNKVVYFYMPINNPTNPTLCCLYVFES